jgi:hypothetical protein
MKMTEQAIEALREDEHCTCGACCRCLQVCW